MDEIPQFEGKTISQGQGSPFVSVVVPVYNGSRTIVACIESLLGLDYPSDHYEIIVVDNNSTDGTDNIVRQYPVTLLYEREIQTSYAARNTGIQGARGEIVAFTDADCIADRNWLRELVSPFRDHAIGGVGGTVLDSSSTNLVEKFLHSVKPFGRYQSDDCFLAVLATCNAAYRRETLFAVGLFRAKLFTAADVDLSWRVQLRAGAQVCYASQATVIHKHRTSLRGMFLQYRRHGFGEIMLDAMYNGYDGYKRTPRRQLLVMARQIRALLTYVCSFFYRLFVWKLKGKDIMYMASPLFWFVAESGALWGKLSGLWATRFFTRDPSCQLWEDPGER